jgi:viroplasmin and RNaseH domain-containing protein
LIQLTSTYKTFVFKFIFPNFITTMGVAFNQDLLQVETVSDRIDDEEEEYEDTASIAGSEVSMSEFDGLPSELPPECLFGPKECRCTFELSSDNPAIYRVCGIAQGVCKRPGHATGEKAEIGYYEPILARKYVDGKLNTFLSIVEFAVREKERGEARALEMKLASSSLATRKESPTESEEEAYCRVRPSYAAVASNKKHVSEVEDCKMAAKPSLVDTTPLMSTGDVFLKSPTLQKLDASGMTSNAVEPATMMMFGMMDEMKKTMERMNSELTALKLTPSKERMVVSSYEVPDVQPFTMPIKKEIPSASKSGACYGVGHGLDGVHGVFKSWGEVAPLVMGVSKAVYRRFNSYDEAQEFVDISQAVKASQQSELPDGVPSSDIWYSVTNSKIGQFSVFPSWTAAQQHVTNVSGASVRKFGTYGEAQSYVEGHQAAWQLRFSEDSLTITARTGEVVRNTGPHLVAKFASDSQVDEETLPSSNGSTPYPPGRLMGKDPSTGKTDELFGIDTEQSEEELMDALCPPDLSESMARSLMDGTRRSFNRNVTWRWPRLRPFLPCHLIDFLLLNLTPILIPNFLKWGLVASTAVHAYILAAWRLVLGETSLMITHGSLAQRLCVIWPWELQCDPRREKRKKPRISVESKPRESYL